MPSNFANFGQKHTSRNLRTDTIYTGRHTSFYMFVLYLVKTSKDFTPYSIKYEATT